MKNNKSKKKYLLTAGLGLGAVATIVPLTLTVTSCSTDKENNPMDKPNNPTDKPSDSESESFDYKAIIGRNVKWTDKEDKKHEGTLIKVDGNKIWVDKFDGTNITSSNIEEFTLPLESDDFSYDEDKSMSKEEVVAELTKINVDSIQYLETAYTPIKDSIKSFIDGQKEEVQSIGKDMLVIFDKMTTMTSKKIDDAIMELKENNSLKKLDDIINYYTDTVVLSREDFFEKYNEMLKNISEESKPTASLIFGSVINICGAWKGFTNVVSTLKISK